MSQKCEIALYINPSADQQAKDFVAGIKGDNVGEDTIPPKKNLISRKKVLVGGEHSLWTITSNIIKNGQPCVVALAGGGTHNVVFEYLKRTGRVMTVDEFLQTAPDKFPNKLLYHPGEAQDEKGHREIFNNHLGRGAYPRMTATLDKMLRGLPPQIRTRGARLGAAVPAAISREDRLVIYSISDRIGDFIAFKDQDLFDGGLTKAVIEGNYVEQWVKLALTLASWQFSRSPLRGVLRTEQGVIFHDRFRTSSLWIDGENKENFLVGDETTLKRSEIGFPLVGLVR